MFAVEVRDRIPFLKLRVSIETTIPSYLTAWPSRDLGTTMRERDVLAEIRAVRDELARRHGGDAGEVVTGVGRAVASGGPGGRAIRTASTAAPCRGYPTQYGRVRTAWVCFGGLTRRRQAGIGGRGCGFRDIRPIGCKAPDWRADFSRQTEDFVLDGVL